jgi:type IX secretion system PorP/SprF family membrane protein
MTKKLLFFFLFGFLTSIVVAQQDVHFSQFYYSPVVWNPAAAGATSGDLRATATYRNQWASVSTPFTTIGASFDAPIQTRNMGDNFLGLGLHFNNDQAGTSSLSNLDINGSVSYSLDLGSRYKKPHYISFGLNFGFIQRSFNFTNSTWDSQWTGANFDQSLGSGESVRTGKLSKGNITVGAGALWNYAFDDDKRFFLGAAMFHVNRPNMSLIDDQDNLYHKFSYMAGFELGHPDKITTFRPNVMAMMMGPNYFVNAGLDVSFDLTDRTAFTNYKNHMAFGLGVYHRLMDAMIFAVNVEYSNLKVAFAYDLNISGFNVATNGNGAFEIMLIYQPRMSGPETQRQKLRRNKGL